MTDFGRAAVYERPGQPFVIREFPVPQPGPGSILVRLSVSNICGSDLHTWRQAEHGELPDLRLPVIWGHEMTGRIAALGEGVTHDSAGAELGVGDRIVYKDMRPCFRCRACARRNFVACPKLWSHRVPDCASPPYFGGAFAEYYYLVSTFAVYKAPDSISDELLAGVNCAVSQVLFGLERAGLRYGDRLVIQGAGGLGIYMTAIARSMGAAEVIIIDRVADRLELARAFGADATIDITEFPQPDDRVARVRALTDGWGADVVAEVSGNSNAWPEGIAMTGRGGTYLSMGAIVPNRACSVVPADVIRMGKRIVGVAHFEPDTIPRALHFLSTNLHNYPFHRLAADRYPLEDINTAFEDAAAQRAARAALVLD